MMRLLLAVISSLLLAFVPTSPGARAAEPISVSVNTSQPGFPCRDGDSTSLAQKRLSSCPSPSTFALLSPYGRGFGVDWDVGRGPSWEML